MKPVVTGAEMREVDARSGVPKPELIERAGSAAARSAVRVMGGVYGKRVVVIAGSGNNGKDGRVAARRLARRGVRVKILDAVPAPAIPDCDLVVDAAFGTGFRGSYDAPDTRGIPVLSVDIPTGIDSNTGVGKNAVMAGHTVTFAALKPGLLFADGPVHSGNVEIADIGLDVSSASCHVVESSDVASWLPARDRETHKWKRAVYVVAGSPGMTGAASLVATAALRSGAGMVRLGTPGSDATTAIEPTEAVGHALPADGWAAPVLEDLGRFGALVVGPGLGRAGSVASSAEQVVQGAACPVVIDGDGLVVLGGQSDLARVIARRTAPTVITPHDGEFKSLTGAMPSDDRLDEARKLAELLGCVVLLKGSTTVVADASGSALVSMSGDSRLATAGTGDVLAGLIGSFLAGGLSASHAAAAAAHVHGLAARLAHPVGMIASDLLELLPVCLEQLDSDVDA